MLVMLHIALGNVTVVVFDHTQVVFLFIFGQVRLSYCIFILKNCLLARSKGPTSLILMPTTKYDPSWFHSPSVSQNLLCTFAYKSLGTQHKVN
jgi:hypothetical protein